MEIKKDPRLVRELQAYSLGELAEVFGTEEDDRTTKEYAKILQDYGVLKKIEFSQDKDLTDLADEEIIPPAEDDENAKYCYFFRFVGLICFKNIVLKCYPKYIETDDENRIMEQFKQVLLVLRKYSKHKVQKLKQFNPFDEVVGENRLAVVLALLDDYLENGLYINDRQVLEINGSGEINWDRTINDAKPILQDGLPYYTQLMTKRRINNANDFITQLHMSLVTDCCRELDFVLKDLLGIPDLNLTETSCKALGEPGYLEYRINMELNNEFATRKQNVLKTMRSLVKDEANRTDFSVGLYGTTAFNLVWEDCCRVVFQDNLGDTLGELGLATEGFPAKKTLRSIIEGPVWDVNGSESGIEKEAIIPDTIIYRVTDIKRTFAILDAKYYRFGVKEGEFVYKVPGVGDINKQYLYQLAFNELLLANGITEKEIFNVFLMPLEYKDDNVVRNVGNVSVKFFRNLPAKPKLVDIGVRLVPATKLFDAYLGLRDMYLEELEVDRFFDSVKRMDEEE